MKESVLGIDRDELYKLYVEEVKSTKEIAEYFNCTTVTINKYIKDYNIPKSERDKNDPNIIRYSKEVIYEEYIVKHQTQEEIANKYGCDSSYISMMCRKYGITMDMWYESFQLTERQNDIIIGGILGDGCVTKRKGLKNHNYYECHAEDQKDYLDFKFQELKNICKMKSIKLRPGNGYNVQPLYYFTTRNLPILNNYKEEVEKTLDKLNKNSFVIWMMDDGRLDRGEYYTLGMRKHGLASLEYAMSVIKDKFDLNTKIMWNDKEHTVLTGIRFPHSETHKIKHIIDTCDFSEDIHRTMRYKIPE